MKTKSDYDSVKTINCLIEIDIDSFIWRPSERPRFHAAILSKFCNTMQFLFQRAFDISDIYKIDLNHTGECTAIFNENSFIYFSCKLC